MRRCLLKRYVCTFSLFEHHDKLNDDFEHDETLIGANNSEIFCGVNYFHSKFKAE